MLLIKMEAGTVSVLSEKAQIGYSSFLGARFACCYANHCPADGGDKFDPISVAPVAVACGWRPAGLGPAAIEELPLCAARRVSERI